MTDLIARAPSILEASTAAKAAQGEVVKAESSLLMAVEIAQYALEDYAHRPAIAAVLDALTAYQATETARQAARDTLAAALDQDMSDLAADLVETHELRPACRREDLRERIAFIRSELRDLATDAEPAAARGLLGDDLEAEINALVGAR